MKKVIFNRKNKTILTSVLLSLMLSIQGYSKVDVLNLTEDKKLVLDLTEMYGNKATAMIKDQAGSIIFTDMIINDDKNGKKYDLSNLKKGLYQLIIEDAMTVETIPFELSKTKIEYMGKSKIVYKPIIEQNKDQTVTLNHLALKKAVSLEVTKNGEEFYSSSYIDQPSLGLRFDFSKAEKGKYVIKLNTQGKTFYNTITI